MKPQDARKGKSQDEMMREYDISYRAAHSQKLVVKVNPMG